MHMALHKASAIDTSRMYLVKILLDAKMRNHDNSKMETAEGLEPSPMGLQSRVAPSVAVMVGPPGFEPGRTEGQSLPLCR